MHKELSGFGDSAQATMQSNVVGTEPVGVEGCYHIVCRDAECNIKWEEKFDNVVTQVGKQLMLDTLLSGSSYTTAGPYLGLISGASPTVSALDTMTSHAGWTEFIAYTTGSSSAIRGSAVFTSATSNGSGTVGGNVTTKSAGSITYTITGVSGTVGGCFLVTGPGAASTLSNTSGTLYSAGAFATAKAVTSGDTVTVTYATTATS
jgi:hypothetical protein